LNNKTNNQAYSLNQINNAGSLLVNNNQNNKQQNSSQNQYSLQSGLQNFGEFQNRIGTYLSNTISNENTPKATNSSINMQELMRQSLQQQQQQNFEYSTNNSRNNESHSVKFKLEPEVYEQQPNKSNLMDTSPTKPPQRPQGINDSIFREYENQIALQDGDYNMLNQATPGIDELFKTYPVIQQNRNQPSWTHTPVVRNFDEFDAPNSPVGNTKSEETDTSEGFSKRKK
jgi:hypothetical protein